MPFRLSRPLRALTGLVLVLAVLAALAGSSVHSGPHCLVHQDCLACRWSADSVIVLAAPPPILGLECLGTVPSDRDAAAAPASITLASSRAPPRA